MPALATQHTAEGAEAFVRYWFDVLNFGFATGNVSQAIALSAPACQACRETIAYIRQPYDAGSHWEGVRLHVLYSAVPPMDARGAVVTINMEQVAGSVVAASGARVGVPAEAARPANAYVEWDDGWRIFTLSNIS